MAVSICPTLTARGPHSYQEQMDLIQPFAKRVHVDLMDGDFAPTHSQRLEDTWWFENQVADLHIMYRSPWGYLPTIISLQPHLVVVHAEAQLDRLSFVNRLNKHGIKVGIALLQETPVEKIKDVISIFDHVLIFSGNLGYHGGTADLNLLNKVKEVRQLSPDIEIGWDGGINDQNAPTLIEAGVNVLNVGGYIHNASNPEQAYATLEALAE